MQAARLERLALGACTLLAACEPSAASPPEQASPDASPIGQRCRAQTHPIVIHEIELPLAWAVLLTADGSDSLPLAGGSHVYGAVWSPDGRAIALRRYGASTENGTAPSDLTLLTVDGGIEVSLFEDWIPFADNLQQRLPDGPAWSPDGRSLAFASQHEADHWRIWSVSRSGGQLRPLLPELEVPHFYPRWSVSTPAKLAFVAEIDGTQDLFVVDPSSSAEPENLTHGRLARPESPSWSADDRFIAFSAEESEPADPAVPNRDIYVLSVETGELIRATDDSHADIQPTWSPGDGQLLFSSNRGRTPEQDEYFRGFYDLWMQPLDENRRPLSGRAPTQFSSLGARSKNDADWYGRNACESEQ